MWGSGHHPLLGHGDVGPDKPGPDKPLRELAKEVGDFVAGGAKVVAEKAAPVVNALAPGGRKLATRVGGALADVVLDAKPVGANSDKVPPPSERQRQAMDIEVRHTPTGAVQKKEFK
jgi:hypothetical protein